MSSSDESDADSFGTIEEEIGELNHMISELYCAAEDLEDQLMKIRKPLELSQLDQLGQVPFLKSSPFRSAMFKVKAPGFAGIDLEKRYLFQEICAMLRAHLLATAAVQPDGTIRLSDQLKTLFEVEDDSIGYIVLMARLRRVLV